MLMSILPSQQESRSGAERRDPGSIEHLSVPDDTPYHGLVAWIYARGIRWIDEEYSPSWDMSNFSKV